MYATKNQQQILPDNYPGPVYVYPLVCFSTTGSIGFLVVDVNKFGDRDLTGFSE